MSSPLARAPALRFRHSRRVARAALLGAVCVVGFARTALGEPCARPDSPTGYQGFVYGDAPVQVVEGARVRVLYVETGPHAVSVAGVGDSPAAIAALAAEVGDEALAAYESWGFRAPLADPHSICGAGPRVDLYLVRFSGGDGLTAAESCAAHGEATPCTSFVLVDSRLDQHYPTAAAGVRTVVPHELFHAVQNAYDAGQARFWAEGTAQWAAARLSPELPDLIKNLDDFLDEPGRALDGPVTGVTAGYLYGSALWPVFLEQRFGPEVIEQTLAAQASGESALEAADEVLAERGTSLAETYATFVQWNLATGARAPTSGAVGYVDASAYPEAPLKALDLDATEVAGVLSGLSSAPYLWTEARPAELSLEATVERTRGYFLPLRAGRVDLTGVSSLPARAEGPGIVVVINTTTSKLDAPYRLSITEAAPAPPPPPISHDEDTDPASAASDGGCALTSAAHPPSSPSLAFLTLVVGGLSLARRRSLSEPIRERS
jgi:hypothetical protein